MSARALYIGVDVHEKESQVAVYEQGGELLQEKRMPTRRLPRFVSSLQGGKKHVGIESVGFIYPIYDALLKAGCDVAVANPNNIQLIARTKIKHDKVDARVLGELLRTDFFLRSHIPDEETREKRLLTRERVRYGVRRAELRNSIKWFLKRRGITVKKPLSREGRAKIKSLALPELDYRLKELELVESIVDELDRRISISAAKDRGARLIDTIPGVGAYTALFLSSALDDVNRFACAYLVKLGVEIGRLKNSVIGYLKREGVYDSLPKTRDNFSVRRRRAIRSLRFHDKRDLILGTMMDRLHFLESQCTPLEDGVRENARVSDDVKILMSITGVDFYLASLISSFIGDVERFPSDAHLASFFGIIPTSRDSADVKRRGRMSKDGSSIARWALSVMVDTVTQHNEPIKAYYQSVKKRTGSGKLAHVSTMRKLTRMLYHMLKTRQHWKWENPRLTERKMTRLEMWGGSVS